jgi:hypothetical protein
MENNKYIHHFPRNEFRLRVIDYLRSVMKLKILLLALLPALLFINCKTSRTKGNPTLTGSKGEMQKISGTVMLTQSYCGGAAPSPEMLEEIRQPHPYSGCKLIFKSGNENTLHPKMKFETTTGADGTYEIELPSGTWCIVQAWQADESELNHYRNLNAPEMQVDVDCLESNWHACLRIVEIFDAPLDSVDFEFHEICFQPIGIPCLNYTGPMPP